jgi:5-(carboxyamino)imidazole ribonucleotide synthase
VRAVAGWPLGEPVRHSDVEMINLIGAEIEETARWLAVPGACVHHYGKAEARPGRKMGHVTRLLGPASAGKAG